MYIYKITNKINGKIYIGLTTISPEKSKHYYGSGTYIVRAIKKYGKHNFTKDILEQNIKSNDDLHAAEINWINLHNATNPDIGYNISTGGESGAIGHKHSEETKKIISDHSKNISKETRIKLSKASKGRILSEDHKRKIKESNIGQKRSEDAKNKMSIGGKGKILSDEHRNNISKASKGRVFSEETRRKLSESNKRTKALNKDKSASSNDSDK